MFSKWIVFLLRLFDIFGFFTEYPTQNNKSYRKRTLLILLFHFLIAVCTLVIALNCAEKPNSLMSSAFIVNQSIMLHGLLCCYWLSVSESYVQRNVQRKFWSILKQIDKFYCQKNRIFMRNYCLKLVEFIPTVIAVDVVIMYYVSRANDSGGKFSTYLYSQIILLIILKIDFLRIFYYLFHVDLIKYELIKIENEVREMMRISRQKCSWVVYNKVLRTRRFHENRYNWLREYYRLVFGLTECMNSVFARSQFASFLFLFNCLFSVTVLIMVIMWADWTLEVLLIGKF